jgi:hypothetical protein
MRCTLNLENSLRTILGSPELAFKNMGKSNLPETAGVYLIFAGKGLYYVGCTVNLYSGLYSEQLMGNFRAATLKRHLFRKGKCRNLDEAKDFLLNNASVRWIEEGDMANRRDLKVYFTHVLFPKDGIVKEH